MDVGGLEQRMRYYYTQTKADVGTVQVHRGMGCPNSPFWAEFSLSEGGATFSFSFPSLTWVGSEAACFSHWSENKRPTQIQCRGLKEIVKKKNNKTL